MSKQSPSSFWTLGARAVIAVVGQGISWRVSPYPSQPRTLAIKDSGTGRRSGALTGISVLDAFGNSLRAKQMLWGPCVPDAWERRCACVNGVQC